ncbi:MAG: ShlB/FhaC/HecB family hemolysin secretion/activation protein [Rhizobacter sp.]|nr:ShlB/FhaC/HecB family hemolysin secretion/activation protein [Rhizobacter sp.]
MRAPFCHRSWRVALRAAPMAAVAGLLVGASAPQAQSSAAPAGAPPGAVPRADAAQAAPKDVPFVLREIRLPRTVAVPEDEVFGVVAVYLRHAVGSPELSAIAAGIRQLYDRRGLSLVNIGLTVQDLNSGSLEVAVVEPRIARIEIATGSQPPISEARAREVLENLDLRDGVPLNLNRLDRAMFTLNDWPGVSARATLAPAGDEGAFNLLLAVEPGPGLSGSIDFDNHGTVSSGRHRLGGLLRWNNPLGIGDNLDVRALVSDAQRVTVARVAYEAPLGATPWRAGAGYSRVTYELGGNFAVLGAVGSADVVDVSLSYPLIRAREHNLTSRVALETKRLEDRFDAFAIRSDKRIDGAQFALAFEARDRFWGGGYTGGQFGLQVGRLRIDTADVRANDAALGERATQGSFSKFSLQVNRLQAITGNFAGYVGLAGQWASKNLDNAEKLTLGGAKGVRSYPGGEAPVDEGVIVNSELRWWIDANWTVFTFYDWAHGTLQKRPNPALDNTRILRGAGLGLQFTKPDLINVKASLGWRGQEPVLSESGNDRTRFLIQAQRSF